jgi:hypothetical protein
VFGQRYGILRKERALPSLLKIPKTAIQALTTISFAKKIAKDGSQTCISEKKDFIFGRFYRRYENQQHIFLLLLFLF